VALVAVHGCKPDLGPGDSLIATTRVLAVRSDPAEATAGSVVTLTSFVASPDGTVSDASIAWSACVAPKPLTTDNAVSDACLGASSSLAPVGVGPAVYARTPANGCQLFGPETPPGDFRPRDPDVTGGYYQPVRLDLAGADTAFALLRLACGVGNGSAAQASQFAKAYVLNTNPHLGPLGAAVDGVPLDQAQVAPGARVALTASWTDADVEMYAWLDPGTQAVVMKRESMRVAWYASAGSFDTETSGRSEDDPVTNAASTWTAPSSPGTAHLWIVLRDSRGGVDFAGYDLAVVP
jgi:hypothetical protein